jgi:hypothetical protein
MLFVISGMTTLGRAAPGERAGSALDTDCFATCDANRKAADFFICFGHNPLKSLDSTKQIQINPRILVWIYLDFLALSSRPGCRSRSDAVIGRAGCYRRSHSRFIDAAGLA